MGSQRTEASWMRRMAQVWKAQHVWGRELMLWKYLGSGSTWNSYDTARASFLHSSPCPWLSAHPQWKAVCELPTLLRSPAFTGSSPRCVEPLPSRKHVIDLVLITPQWGEQDKLSSWRGSWPSWLTHLFLTPVTPGSSSPISAPS